MNEPTSPRFFFQPNVRRETLAPDPAALAFHRRLPGYAPTPLLEAPAIARSLGIEQLLVKDESARLGLPAFKILGASWAVYRTLEEGLGRPVAPWRTVAELSEQFAPLRPLCLTTATDGNHGRAVARVAALFGLEAQIYLPRGAAQARIDGIASEGARVEIVDGTYDEAVARAAANASERCLVISDTSWPGYERIPAWVAEGYSTIFSEIDQQIARRGESGPNLVAIQFGVGALATALVRHAWDGTRPKILSVEPLRAACALASMSRGERVMVPGPHDSIMAGLNCGQVSLIAWPIVARGIEAFLAVPDERSREAMRSLARAGIVAGETGAAALAGLIELFKGEASAELRRALEIDERTRALVLVTEGATDPESYRRIVV